jgi:hypothetical protein
MLIPNESENKKIKFKTAVLGRLRRHTGKATKIIFRKQTGTNIPKRQLAIHSCKTPENTKTANFAITEFPIKI